MIFTILLWLMPVMGWGQSRIGVDGTRFTLDGKPFAYTGVSFFNAIYNPAFHRDAERRRAWLAKFRKYGINVLRVWGQWDNPRGFVDSCGRCTLYRADGSLDAEHLARLKAILETAREEGFVVELTLFSQESWRSNIRLADGAMEEAGRNLARELRPFGNVTFQVWNEFSHHTVAIVKAIKGVDESGW